MYDNDDNSVSSVSTKSSSKSSRSNKSINSLIYLNEKLTEQNALLIRENNELKQQLLKQSSNSNDQLFNLCNMLINNNSGSGSSKSSSSKDKSFDVDKYLNENYKDAVNLSTFLDLITISRSDLTDGIANNKSVDTFVNVMRRALQDIGKYKNPLHIDKKKNILYYRDNDKWNEEYSIQNIFNKISFTVEKKLFKNQSNFKKKMDNSDNDEILHSTIMMNLCSLSHKDIANQMIKKLMPILAIDNV